MKTCVYLVLFVFVAATLAACGNSRRTSRGGRGGDDPPPTDAGSTTTDAGTSSGEDGGGGIMLMDSGTTTPECTRPGDCDPGEDCTGGMCVPGTSDCPFTEIVGEVGAGCTVETQECVDACASGDGTCVGGCLDADANGDDCIACVNTHSWECAADNGCQEQYNCWIQCFNDNCTSASDVGACLDSMCSAETAAFNSCQSDTSDTCVGVARACFPS